MEGTRFPPIYFRELVMKKLVLFITLLVISSISSPGWFADYFSKTEKSIPQSIASAPSYWTTLWQYKWPALAVGALGIGALAYTYAEKPWFSIAAIQNSIRSWLGLSEEPTTSIMPPSVEEIQDQARASSSETHQEHVLGTLPKRFSDSGRKSNELDTSMKRLSDDASKNLDARKEFIRTFSNRLLTLRASNIINLTTSLTAAEDIKKIDINDITPEQLFQILMSEAYFNSQFKLTKKQNDILSSKTYKQHSLLFYFEKVQNIIKQIQELEQLAKEPSTETIQDDIENYIEQHQDRFMIEFYKIPSKNALIKEFKNAMKEKEEHPTAANEEMAMKAIEKLNGKTPAAKAANELLTKELDAFLDQKRVDYTRSKKYDERLATLDNQILKLNEEWAAIATPIIWPKMARGRARL